VWQTRPPTVNNTVGYQRDPFGVVHLRGIAQNCGGMNTIFNLPAGDRPGFQGVMAGIDSSGSARRLDVDAGGAVNLDVLASDGEWISLDGLTFRCAASGSNGCP
jgi:hypothetical protein